MAAERLAAFPRTYRIRRMDRASRHPREHRWRAWPIYWSGRAVDAQVTGLQRRIVGMLSLLSLLGYGWWLPMPSALATVQRIIGGATQSDCVADR